MRFVNYNTKGKTSLLFFDDAPVPIPGPDEVLIKVHAFGVNRADLLQVQGHYPPPEGASKILGLECSGVVCGLGTNMSLWEVGDEVCGLVDGGAYAEYCTIDGRMIWKKSDRHSWEEGAAMPETYLTAYQALYELMDVTKMWRGVLIHAAASGVGLAAVQLLQHLELKKWGTASGGKTNFCLEHGYDAVINYKEDSFYDKIMEWTDGAGVDGIVDVVGASYFSDNLKALAMDGNLVMLGVLSGIKTEQTNILPIISRRLTVRGSTLRSRQMTYKRQLFSRFMDRFGMQITSAQLVPVIYKSLPWTEVVHAHDIMRQNENIGKIVLSIP